jgi:hypothetical protein
VALTAPYYSITMTGSVSSKSDIRFPTADFFYPKLIVDILEDFDCLHLLGLKTDDNNANDEKHYENGTNYLMTEDGFEAIPTSVIKVLKKP